MKFLRLIALPIVFTTLFLGGSFVTAGNNFEGVLDYILGDNSTGSPLRDNLQRFTFSNSDGSVNVRDMFVYVAVKIILPIGILIGVIIAILGFYKMMSSESDEEQKKGLNYLFRGTLGVIIMIAAGYFANQLVGSEGTTGIFGKYSQAGVEPSGGVIAGELYDKIAFPVLRLFIYIILGILFISAVIQGFTYIFSNDESAQKKALSIILYNTMGILVIILAKSIVESMYGKYSEITKTSIANLGEVGEGVFEAPQFNQSDLFIVAINWILGLATFFILVIILYQGYLLLTNPTNEETIKKLKKNIIYIFIGILVVGAGYLLTNFFIVT